MNNLYSKEDIENFIKENRVEVSAQYVINYWSNKGWKTLKGQFVKNLSAAVHVANSLYLDNIRKGCGSESPIVSDIMKINKRIASVNEKYGKNIPMISLTV